MSQKKNINSPSTSTWEAESLRLTAFPIEPVSISDVDWWAQTVGEDPAIRAEKKREGELREAGPIDNGELRLEISLARARIDWNYIPSGEGPLARLGKFQEVTELFKELMLHWLSIKNLPAINRLAFGAILLLPVDSKEEGYKRLFGYLPFELDTENMGDFFYQINRRKPSNVGPSGLQINRLRRWSLSESSMAQFRFSPGQIVQSLGPPSYACRLLLDINTMHDLEGSLPPETLSNLFQELIALGKEISERGDIA